MKHEKYKRTQFNIAIAGIIEDFASRVDSNSLQSRNAISVQTDRIFVVSKNSFFLSTLRNVEM